jgi:hypothetical protein
VSSLKGEWVSVLVEGELVSVGVGQPSGHHLEGPEIDDGTREEAMALLDGVLQEVDRARVFLGASSAITSQYAVELDAATRRIQGLEREVERLSDVLHRIDGGDNPCLDQDKLRQWAYEAMVQGRSVDELS